MPTRTTTPRTMTKIPTRSGRSPCAPGPSDLASTALRRVTDAVLGFVGSDGVELNVLPSYRFAWENGACLGGDHATRTGGAGWQWLEWMLEGHRARRAKRPARGDHRRTRGGCDVGGRDAARTLGARIG
jgi:hypothetical protein